MFISSQSGGARWVNGGLSSLAPDNSYPADRDDSETRVPLAARLPPACALVAPRLGFMAATRLKLRYPPQVFAEKLLFLSGSQSYLFLCFPIPFSVYMFAVWRWRISE